MKRAGWGVSVFLLLILSGLPANALDTAPSTDTVSKVSGPLIITGYSFAGHSLKYLQVYNSSDDVVSLEGWRVSVEQGTTQQSIVSLSGSVAPLKYLTVANVAVLPSATFVLTDNIAPSDPIVSSITLQSPITSNYLNETVSPSISSSTPRVAGAPATFYFARNISSSTGNYLSTFSAFLPAPGFVLLSDPLYEPLLMTGLKIVEIYPDSSSCSPFDVALTCSDYVKLYNESTVAVDLYQFRIRTGQYGQSASSSNTAMLNGSLDPGHYASIPMSLPSSGGWVWLEDTYGTVKYEPTLVGYPSNTSHDEESWAFDTASNEWKWSRYPSPGNAPNEFGPADVVNNCDGLVISEIAANVATEDQFIEVANNTMNELDVTGCIIQTNRSSTKQYVLQGLLDPAEYQAIYIRDTELTLTKTTSGSVYLLSSDGLNEAHGVKYDDQTEGTSWAFIDNGWRRTYEMSAGALNIWLEYPPCDDGSIRNNETGLCNKIQSESSTVADCGEGKYRSSETNRCRALEASSATVACDPGQYRNPETNRCRSFVSTASVLMPCAANQERNPETNRCRSTQASSQLAPCALNQERNPDTNRCRNKASSVAADFPVETIAQTGEATIGWWAFGGVGTLAAGYAGWEWRREVLGWVKKLGLFGVGRS